MVDLLGFVKKVLKKNDAYVNACNVANTKDNALMNGQKNSKIINTFTIIQCGQVFGFSL